MAFNIVCFVNYFGVTPENVKMVLARLVDEVLKTKEDQTRGTIDCPYINSFHDRL